MASFSVFSCPCPWTRKEASFPRNRRPGKEVAEPTKNWLVDLPLDVALLVLKKVGAVNILMNVQKVCVSWRRICRNPILWRSINMHFENIEDMPCDIVGMTKNAINRSCGQLLDINFEYFGTDDLLKDIANSTNQLRRLRIVKCLAISEEGLTEAVKQLPFLEEVHIYFGNFTSTCLEAVGTSCPSLKSFTFNQQEAMSHIIIGFDNDGFNPNAEAFAISRTMPQLHHLNLFGNQMTNEGLQAILDSCPHLESLDIRHCLKLDLSGTLGKRCRSSIKALRLPNDSTDDYEFDITIFNNSFGNDSVELTDHGNDHHFFQNIYYNLFIEGHVLAGHGDVIEEF